MAEEPTRDGLIEAFRPIASLLEEITELAQGEAKEEGVRDAHPLVGRQAHRRRLMGSLRWMIASDQLVLRIAETPDGFSCLTTDADHNQGRYAFSFPGRPGGVFMVRRTPHEPGEGEYVQERLDGVLENAPLAEQFKHSPLKIYLSIPARGNARLIGEHPAWTERVSIALSELRLSAPVVSVPTTPIVRPQVRSVRRVEESANDVRERGEQQS